MTISNEHIITLSSVRGIGPVALVRICERVNGLKENSFGLGDLYDLVEEMVKGKEITRVTMPEYEDFESANATARRILSSSEKLGIHAVSRYEEGFPKMLLHTVSEDGRPQVPTLLYYKGDLSITERPALAVIGTREPTKAGETAGRYYAGAFASVGVNIVSGLAVGCDTAGHRGALDAGGVTTAFLAHGLDSVYPQENAALAEEIVEKGGLLMSEYPVGTWVNRYNLVARDRLQAGLSDATLVVQTGVHGGTMHAVRATQAAGKQLFVVDYQKDEGEKAEGNSWLKTQGAAGLRISDKAIREDPDRFIAMLKGQNPDNRKEGEKAAEEPFKDTLF